MSEFKTPPVDLGPFEKKKLTGFFDTAPFSLGEYNANITINYYGGDIKKVSSEVVKIRFISQFKKRNNLTYYLIIALVILIIVTFVVYKIILKKKNEKKTKTKKKRS